MDRLDMHHEIFMQLLNGELHRAPIGNTPQQILDVGTGTGIWAIDMADKYPNSIITGTDLRSASPSPHILDGFFVLTLFSPSQPTW
jgi:ubiquinone/menaquinone biosynthesis C-methylase UbiE